ncbi:LuxR C-terminal-related transcriptional regulator [Streptomyces gardneri]|uniref:LuxR C-terminal-related transcriptional regulator n=1 Tax=Streptomyces gardneri TaxID=66892 RepID=UPI0036CC250B
MTRTSSSAGPSPAGGGPVPHLSPNEFAVLAGSSQGATYGQLGRELHITEKAVGNIAMRVVRKLEAQNITHAVFLGCRLGLLDARLPRARTGEVPVEASLPLLRSLVAEGFSVSYIASQMGMGQPELSALMGRESMTEVMEARVRLVFAELGGRDPLVLGVHPRGVTRARNRARAEGWEVIPADVVRHVA